MHNEEMKDILKNPIKLQSTNFLTKFSVLEILSSAETKSLWGRKLWVAWNYSKVNNLFLQYWDKIHFH